MGLKISQRHFSFFVCVSPLSVSCVGCSYLHNFREKQMSAIKAVIELIQFFAISQDVQTDILMILHICRDNCENLTWIVFKTMQLFPEGLTVMTIITFKTILFWQKVHLHLLTSKWCCLRTVYIQWSSFGNGISMTSNSFFLMKDEIVVRKKRLYILWISNSHTGYIPVLCCRGRTPQKMVISTWKYITGNKFSFTSVSVYYLQVLSEIHLKCSVKWGLRQLQQPHKAFTALVKQ